MAWLVKATGLLLGLEKLAAACFKGTQMRCLRQRLILHSGLFCPFAHLLRRDRSCNSLVFVTDTVEHVSRGLDRGDAPRTVDAPY